MAEVALGTVSLVALFDTCMSFYDRFESLNSKSNDLTYIVTRVSFEQNRFALLEARVSSPGILWHVSAQRLVRLTLSQIKISLKLLHDLLSYHLDHHDGQDERAPKSKQKLSRAVRWVSKDQKKATEMVTRLKALNEQLELMLPVEHQRALNFGFTARLVATSDVARLRGLEATLRYTYPKVAQAAEVKASRIESFNGLLSGGRELERSQINDLNGFRWAHESALAGTRLSDCSYDTSIHDVARRERTAALFTSTATSSDPKIPIPVLVEWRTSFRSVGSIQRRKYRLDQLVLSLNQLSLSDSEHESPPDSDELATTSPPPSHSTTNTVHHPNQFTVQTLPCSGWVTLDNELSHVGLVFQFPPHRHRNPISLFDRIQQDRRSKRPAPALGARFDMATKLVETIANFIIVGWVHKSIRSHNLLIFEPDSSAPQHEPHKTNLDTLYLTGFSYSRPGDPDDLVDDSTLPTQNAVYELYRPPAQPAQHHHRLGPASDPTQSSSNQETPVRSPRDAALDIYGLGIVLLEIAAWKTVDAIYKTISPGTNTDDQRRNGEHVVDTNNPLATAASDNGGLESPGPRPRQITDQLSRFVTSLEPRVGVRYCAVIRKCLSLDDWYRRPMGGGGSADVSRDSELVGVEYGRTSESRQWDGSTSTQGVESVGSEEGFLESIIQMLSQCRA